MIVASRTGQWLLAAAALAMASMPLWASSWHMQLASTALVAALFALSLQVLVGATGLVSLAQAGFFGLGAYVVPLLGSPPVWVTLSAAVMVAGVAALAIGPLALRTRGFFFLMTTLAFGQMLFFAFHDTPLGGGTDGLFVTRPSLGFPVSRAARPAIFLALNLVVLAGVYAALCQLMRTTLGHALQGIRSNENRMAALGHNVQRLKLIAFVLSSGLAGLAGQMSVLTDAFVSPELLGWQRSAEALLMILLGGIGALHGPILGALAFTAIQEAGTLLTDRPRLVEGIVFLAAVLFLRQGLAGLRLPSAMFSRIGPRGGNAPAIVSPGPSREAMPCAVPMPDHGASVLGASAVLPTMRAEGLTRRFGGLLAVDQVSLALNMGVLHAVIGPNGAGKSTLVNLLAGEIASSAGSVRLGGQDISKWAPWRRGRAGIGRTFQRTNVMRDITVLGNTCLAAQVHATIGLLGNADSAGVMKTALSALDRVGLSGAAGQVAGTLSHGQARLLEIAMALAGSPVALLLDEPLSGLGPEESAPVANLLRELAHDHAMLLVEHDMDVVFAIADIITVMVDGRVLASGTPHEIRASATVRDAYLGHAA